MTSNGIFNLQVYRQKNVKKKRCKNIKFLEKIFY
jgi:hypothetical protein